MGSRLIKKYQASRPVSCNLRNVIDKVGGKSKTNITDAKQHDILYINSL